MHGCANKKFWVVTAQFDEYRPRQEGKYNQATRHQDPGVIAPQVIGIVASWFDIDSDFWWGKQEEGESG